MTKEIVNLIEDYNKLIKEDSNLIKNNSVKNTLNFVTANASLC